MTIAIISEHFPLIPLATEQVFNTFWKKAAMEMNLIWIPLFEIGITIEKNDYFEIEKEIIMVKNWLDKQNLEENEKKSLLNRINFILDELNKRFLLENSLYFG